MFKNKRVILSSIAIIFTLVVCSIVVNFTLATSTTSTDGSGATTSSTSSIVGKTNIDLAIENSNNSNLSASGQDKFNIVQILPEGMESYVTNEAELTEKVTSSSYSGTVAEEDLFESTTSLWKYVYDRELMRYAVFENYKTIDDEMAEGAVQLTSVTVSDLNGMGTTAQNLLSNADLIYIAATGTSDYASTSKDISDDLYNFLVEYATSDNKPLIIDAGALCSEPSAISGNNDTYLMGAFAYKVMTSSLSSRYSNVLVTDWDYFATLYTEASGNYKINTVTNTTKTISDFIITAENTRGDGGNNYLYGGNTYYKWYVDGDGSSSSVKESLATFLGRKSAYDDSSYIKVDNLNTSETTGTASNTEWDFDNAKILIITDGTSNSILSALDSTNDATMDSSVYTYDDATGTWVSKSKASNSSFTASNSAYLSGLTSYPSGADIYVISTADENLKNAVESTGTLTNASLASSYYEDITTTSVSVKISSTDEITTANATVYLLATDSEGNTYIVTDGTYGSDTADTVLSATDGSLVADSDNTTGSYIYTCDFSQLDSGKYYVDSSTGEIKSDGTGYTYTPVLVVSDGAATPTYSYYSASYDADTYTFSTETAMTDTDFDNNACASMVRTYITDSTSSEITYINLLLDSESDVAELVEDLHDDYTTYVTSLYSSFTISSFSDYDFIFIESGKYNDEIDTKAYNLLCEAVEAGTYVIVSGDAGNGVGSATDGESSSDVSVISPSAKAIADIINAGTYRNGSDNKYRVLEIQPDYPIDTELAESQTSKSKYSTHSDGTSFTGSYYTVPSDVVEGSAKEELAEDTEYYDFDLTKAKIAYALKDQGISYSDIELTQVSTEALIGMTEDISATYDLVYIGGDISALDKSIEEAYKYGSNKDDLNDGTWKYLSSVIPTFIMYYHTGVLWEVYNDDSGKLGVSEPFMVTGINGGTDKVFVPENGNDLTSTKYDELVAYINSGRPIMISDELTSVYENMNGVNVSGASELTMVQLLAGYWYNENGVLEKGNYYLDPSSQMYNLVDYIYTTYTKQKSDSDNNILWGVDTSENSETMITNTSQDYGITLYTYYNGTSYLDSEVQDKDWYSTDGTIQQYAVVFDEDTNADIANLVSNSSSRVRLTVSNSPTTYQEGNTSTYLSTTSLSFTFEIEADSGSYNYTIWVDSNKNSQFDDNDKDGSYYYTSGTASSGTEISKNVYLEDDYFGSAYWRIQITDSKDNVVAERTGIAKIVNNTDSTSEINVLQINTGINTTQGSQSFSDTLYFDIRSQMAHKILYYNPSITNNFSSSSGTTLSENSDLGRHEYRFGIVKYDTSATDDDWFSNLADELTDDYDISLDIAVAETKYLSSNFTSNNLYDSIEQWAIEADALEANDGTGTYEGYTMAQYSTMADKAFEEYCTLIAVTEEKKTEIDTFLYSVISYLNSGTGSTADIQTFLGNLTPKISTSRIIELCTNAIENDEYYLIFQGCFSQGGTTFSNYGEFGDLFVAYRDAKNAELDKRDEYKKYLRRSYGGDFLSKMYSIIVIGPSQDFGANSVDLSESACKYLLQYIEAGGDVFFFHDTMTPFYSAGSVNLTTSLLDIVGMNRFHVDMTNQSASYDTTTAKTVTGYTSATPAGAVQVKSLDAGNTYLEVINNISCSSASDDTIEVLVGNWTDTATAGTTIYQTSYQSDSSWTHVTDGSLKNTDGNTVSDYYYKTADGTETNYYELVTATKYLVVDGNNNQYKYFYERTATTTKSYVYVYQDAKAAEPVYGDETSSLEYNSGNTGYSTTKTSYSSYVDSKYYLTPYANNLTSIMETGSMAVSNATNAANAGVSLSGNNYKLTSLFSSYSISAVAMTPLYFSGEKYGSYFPYIYATTSTANLRGTKNDSSEDPSGYAQTARAVRLNEGLITLYPFSIADTMLTGGTHQQAYALDLENENTTVWYTLAGSNNGWANSSFYAADPYDAMESYFIYTTAYGDAAITYCGAGHTSITGTQAKNNDERMLFINVIVNSADAVTAKPKLKLYEYNDTELTDELETDSELTSDVGRTIYLVEADGKTSSVSFDIGITIPSGVKVRSVKIYFDLNWTEDTNRPIYESGTDVLIYSSLDPTATSSMYTSIKTLSNTDTLIAYALNGIKLSDSYFTYTGNNYTYIVVEVYYDDSTTPVYAIIKIKVSDPLFELTEGTYSIDLSLADGIGEEKFKLS